MCVGEAAGDYQCGSPLHPVGDPCGVIDCEGTCRPVEGAGAEAGAEAEEAPAGAEAGVSSWNPFLMNCSLTFGIL